MCSLPVFERKSWAVAASFSWSRPWSSTAAPSAARRSATARPSPSVAPVTSTVVSSMGRTGSGSGGEGVELRQDVRAAGPTFEAVLDLPPDQAHVGLMAHPDRLGPSAVPDLADDLGAG